MAGKTKVLNEIDETFCQCPICFDQYKEPKQLPCLHRYCLKCLRQLLQPTDTIIKCPECRKEFPVPVEGIHGFSSDFYMQKLIEYIELKKSLEKSETIKVCYGCSQETQMSAYCALCGNFLCSDCHNYHAASNFFKDHKAHLMNINDTELQNILTKRFESPNKAPRCLIHRENVAQLCCSTCKNLPICLTCTYGEHKNHDIVDVITFANTERVRLEKVMGPLYKAKETLDKESTSLGKIKEDIISFAAEKTNNLQLQYDKEIEGIEMKRKLFKQGSELDETIITNNLELRCSNLQEQMEEELQEIRDKFEKRLTKEKNEAQQKLQNIQQKLQLEDLELIKDSKLLEKNFNDAVLSLENEKQRKLGDTETISQHYDSTRKRFENLEATASGILKSQCNWTAAQCIPEIRTATQPLMADMNKRFPDVNDLSHFCFNLTLKSLVDEIILRDVRGNAWNINCITSTSNSDIVTCGSGSGSSSHITVVDAEGNTIHQRQLRGNQSSRKQIWRFCCPLQNNKVATVCWPAEIGIFDTRDGSYSCKNIRDITKTWPEYQLVWSVARDRQNKRIIVVGRESNTVHVFNDQLKYCYNFKIPSIIHWPRDITISRGNIIVCDLSGKGAYAIDMKGELVYKFCEVQCDGVPCGPYNACTDKNGFVWMLYTNGKEHSILLKYNENGQQYQVFKRIDGSAECLTEYQTTDASMILVASYSTGKIYKFPQ